MAVSLEKAYGATAAANKKKSETNFTIRTGIPSFYINAIRPATKKNNLY